MNPTRITRTNCYQIGLFMVYNTMINICEFSVPNMNIDIIDLFFLMIPYYMLWGFVMLSTAQFLIPISIKKLLLIYFALTLDVFQRLCISHFVFGNAFAINNISSALYFLFVVPIIHPLHKIIFPISYLISL